MTYEQMKTACNENRTVRTTGPVDVWVFDLDAHAWCKKHIVGKGVRATVGGYNDRFKVAFENGVRGWCDADNFEIRGLEGSAFTGKMEGGPDGPRKVLRYT